jgi:hypothetical protein
MGDSDVSDAYGILLGQDAEKDATTTLNYVVDGSIYTTFWESGDTAKVKTTRVDLKTSTKLDSKNAAGTITKIDGHVVVKNGDKDQKADGCQ